MIKGVPQSEEPGALLLGFTLSISVRTLLKTHTQKSNEDEEATCCYQVQTRPE